MNNTIGGVSINKTILQIGTRSAIMIIIVFIPMYVISINTTIPELKLLPVICIIPPLFYGFMVFKLKRTEKEFFIILKKQGGKCVICRVPITEMSENTWLMHNKVYCLKCGEKYDRWHYSRRAIKMSNDYLIVPIGIISSNAVAMVIAYFYFRNKNKKERTSITWYYRGWDHE